MSRPSPRVENPDESSRNTTSCFDFSTVEDSRFGPPGYRPGIPTFRYCADWPGAAPWRSSAHTILHVRILRSDRHLHALSPTPERPSPPPLDSRNSGAPRTTSPRSSRTRSSTVEDGVDNSPDCGNVESGAAAVVARRWRSVVRWIREAGASYETAVADCPTASAREVALHILADRYGDASGTDARQGTAHGGIDIRDTAVFELAEFQEAAVRRAVRTLRQR